MILKVIYNINKQRVYYNVVVLWATVAQCRVVVVATAPSPNMNCCNIA